MLIHRFLAPAALRLLAACVESLNAQRVVLQIPVARFRPLYGQIPGLGEVRDKALWARDVTEKFPDIELRLTQAKATIVVGSGGELAAYKPQRDKILAAIRAADLAGGR